MRAVVKRIVVLSLLFLFSAAPAAAQDLACPSGNLLSGKSPLARPGVTHAERLTDGFVAAEGDPWQSELTSVLADSRSHVIYDLGAITRLTAVDLQGDNNDDYVVELSDDRRSFAPLWVADPASGQGMRRRGSRGLSGQGRYLRIRAQGGDSFYSLSEVLAFCDTPSAWPPAVQVKQTSSWWWKKIVEKRDHRYRLSVAVLGLLFFIALFRIEENKKALWVASALSITMLAVSGYRLYGARLAPWFAEWGVYVLGASVLVWAARGIWLVGQSQEARQWLQRGALLWVILASATAWVNFGVFHTSRVVHYWDTFHYYVGSKYFEETRRSGPGKAKDPRPGRQPPALHQQGRRHSLPEDLRGAFLARALGGLSLRYALFPDRHGVRLVERHVDGPRLQREPDLQHGGRVSHEHRLAGATAQGLLR